MNPIGSLLLAATGLVPTQEPPPAAVFRADVELVRVEVSVTRDARPVEGLTAVDFEVWDNGVRQTLNPLLREAVPLDVALALDMSQSVKGERLAALREAAGAFLDGLRSEDRAALVVFSERIVLLEPLRPDRDRVRETLNQIGGSGSTALRDAIYVVLRFRQPDSTRRAAAIVLTDGVENMSWLTGEDVLEAAKRSDVVVYVVLAQFGPNFGRPDQDLLRGVARETGGRLWEVKPGGSLRESFVQVLEHIRSRYLLTYSPQGVDTPGWHKLEVRLKGRRGDVLARPGYVRAGTP